MGNEIGFVIQARSGSTRLPGKILRPFYKDSGILEIIINNIQNYFPSYPIILATTDSAIDDKTAELGNSMGVIVFRGDEDNVVLRMLHAAQQAKISTVVRVCADNPFLNMDLIKVLLEAFKQNKEKDYLSFSTSEGIPVIRSHFGLFVEIIQTSTLRKILEDTSDSFYLEHVTNYAYGHPNEFDIELIPLPDNIVSRKDLRFTIDNSDDFKICQHIMQELKENAQNIDTLISYADDNGLTDSMKTQISKYEK